MDRRLFTLVEIALIAGLIIAVMYFGGVFNLYLNPTTPGPTPQSIPKVLTATPRATTTLPPPTPTFPPLARPEGQIVFASTRDGNSEIYLMSADGSDPRNLTNSPAEDYGPAWSPDGGRIAFFSTRSGWLEIYAMDAAGSDVTRLTQSQGTNAAYHSPIAWSPDGERILVLRWPVWGPGGYPAWSALDVVEADGSGARAVYESNDYLSWPVWSPDGNHIAVILYNNQGHCSLQFLELSGAPSDFQPDFNVCSPFAWESGASRIAYANGQIYLAALDGSNTATLKGVEAAQIFSWSPDGRYLLYFHASGAVINAVGADGARRLDLRLPMNYESLPSWSRDSQWVAFVSEENAQTDVNIVNIYDAKNAIRLTDTGDNFSPGWRP